MREASRFTAIVSLVSGDGPPAVCGQALLNLVNGADYAKLGESSAEDKVLYSAAETGFVGQNVYLFCASEGPAAVVRAMIDRPGLARALKLRTGQKIDLSQTAGYPRPAE